MRGEIVCVLAAVLAVAVSSCAHRPEESQRSGEMKPPPEAVPVNDHLAVGRSGGPDGALQGEQSAGPIIGHLRSRKHTITIHVSSEGHRFTIRSADGKLVAAGLSEEELQQQLPELYERYKSSFAGPGGSLDASVQRTPIR